MGTLRIGNEVVVPLLVRDTGKMDIQPLEVTSNGTYQAPSNSAYNPVNVNVPNTIVSYGEHCDENGIWHYPEDEWSVEYNGVHYDNNIELIPIDTENDEEVLYYLYKANGDSDFCRIRIYGDYTVAWGFSKDGVFTSLGSEDYKSGVYYAKRLTDFGYRTVIFKITPRGTAHLTQAQLNNWVSDGVLTSALSSTYNPVVMRYGNIPYGNLWGSIQSVTLESDNVMNFAKNYTNINISFSAIYNNCYSLQRWRNTGWNLKNNNLTNGALMFHHCFILSDTPEVTDMRGWVSDKTTTLGSMFSGCYCWRNPIDVSDWNLDGLTTATGTSAGLAYLFAEMRSITEIIGLNTWVGGVGITSMFQMFNNNYNLVTFIDLSNMTLGSNLITLEQVFFNCYRVKHIKLPSIDYTSLTTMAQMFHGCYSAEVIECDEPINTSNPVLTTIDYICRYCTSLKSFNILRGLNLANASISGLFAYCSGMTTTDIIDFTGTIFPNVSFKSSSTGATPYVYTYALRKVDLSWFNISLDTATYSHSYLFRELYCCEDFYPPLTGFKAVAFSISNAQRLTRESIVRILNALPTITTALKLTMGSPLLNKLTDEDKSIATTKGWTLA